MAQNERSPIAGARRLRSNNTESLRSSSMPVKCESAPDHDCR